VIRSSLTLLAALSLGGCAAGGSLLSAAAQPTQISGAAAGLFGVPAATTAQQISAEIVELSAVAAQLQMLKAQLDGSGPVLPPLHP